MCVRTPVLVCVCVCVFVCMRELECESNEKNGDGVSESKGVVCESVFVCWA